MLIIDVGNSSVRIAAGSLAGAADPESRAASDSRSTASGSRAVAEIRRIESHPTPRSESVRRALARRVCLLADSEPGRPVVVSVAPAVTECLGVALPGLKVIDHDSPLGFAIDIPDKSAVGADRYANIAAAVGRGWRDALVVDIGTATTFDLLLDGVFAGGLIAPGPAFAADSLGKKAARLRPAPFKPCPLTVGRSTPDAMQAGAWHVGLRGILHTVRDLLAVYGPRPVVLTGGLSAVIHSELGAADREAWLCDPEWTLEGACLVAAAMK